MEEAGAEGHLASDTPGRLRVRIRGDSLSPIMQRARALMEGRPGVHKVETNDLTGSFLVRYDPHRHRTADVIAMLRDAGLIVHQMEEEAEIGLPEVGQSTTSTSIIAALSDLDRRLSLLTGRRVDLKLLFPLGMGALGLRQAFTRGLGLSQIPAYILLWYAFDSFFKLHVQPARPGINRPNPPSS